MTTAPLMPMATAVWLIDNTSLTFEQIAEFCKMHPLEVQALADGELGGDLVPFDPISNNQLTLEEIDRCSQDTSSRLKGLARVVLEDKKPRKGGRYTPLSKRQDKPHAIAWILKHYPEASDATICRLLGTTTATIHAVRDKTHWDSPNIKPRSPVVLGLCSPDELTKALGDAEPKV